MIFAPPHLGYEGKLVHISVPSDEVIVQLNLVQHLINSGMQVAVIPPYSELKFQTQKVVNLFEKNCAVLDIRLRHYCFPKQVFYLSIGAVHEITNRTHIRRVPSLHVLYYLLFYLIAQKMNKGLGGPNDACAIVRVLLKQ